MVRVSTQNCANGDVVAYPGAQNRSAYIIGATTDANIAACDNGETDEQETNEETMPLRSRKQLPPSRVVDNGIRAILLAVVLASFASLVLTVAWWETHKQQRQQQQQQPQPLPQLMQNRPKLPQRTQDACWKETVLGTLRGPCSADECRERWGKMQPGLVTAAGSAGVRCNQ